MSPLPGLALHPGLRLAPPTRHPHVSSAPRRTPAQGTNAHRVTRLSCSSSSSGSAGTRTTRGWTGLTFALQQPRSPLPRTVRRPGPRSPGRPPATRARVPGGSPPTCRGPLTRQCPGGRVAEAAFRGPHGHVREELGGTGGRTRQPRPRPRPRRCVPTARTTPPPALLTRPFNLPTERPRVRRLQGTRPRPLQNEVSWEALRSLPRGPGSWREGRLLSPLLATRLAGHPVPRVSAPEFPIDVTSPPHTHAHACTHTRAHRHTHRHTRTHT